MPSPPCPYCDLAIDKWKYDRERIDPITNEAANMPWDVNYSKGALEAWRIVKRLSLGDGGHILT